MLTIAYVLIAVWVACLAGFLVFLARTNSPAERMEAARRSAERERAELDAIPVLPYDSESPGS